MTPDEYERRPEVKEALKLVRKYRQHLIVSGWRNFKLHLMDLLGIPRDQANDWDVPIEFQYAYKRVGRQPGERGWSKEDAFRQIVEPAIRRGEINLEGPELGVRKGEPRVVPYGDLTFFLERVGPTVFDVRVVDTIGNEFEARYDAWDIKASYRDVAHKLLDDLVGAEERLKYFDLKRSDPHPWFPGFTWGDLIDIANMFGPALTEAKRIIDDVSAQYWEEREEK